MDHIHSKKVTTAGLLITLGIIFGDIGTSPLYTFQTILAEGGKVSESLVFGAISCVFWTLTLQTTFKYVFITLQADNKGEGGSFPFMPWYAVMGKSWSIRRSSAPARCWPTASLLRRSR
jgi:K+ transporter